MMNDQTFFMPILDAFTIKMRGTIVTGTVFSGQVRKGDEIEIHLFDGTSIRTQVDALEGFIKDRDNFWCENGDNCALVLKNVDAGILKRGMAIATPETVSSHSSFKAAIDVIDPRSIGFPYEANYPILPRFSLSFPHKFEGDPKLHIYQENFPCKGNVLNAPKHIWQEAKYGDSLMVHIQTSVKLVFAEDWRFAVDVVYKSGKVSFLMPFGIGTIIELLD